MAGSSSVVGGHRREACQPSIGAGDNISGAEGGRLRLVGDYRFRGAAKDTREVLCATPAGRKNEGKYSARGKGRVF